MRYLSLISNSLFRGYYITKMSYQKVGRVYTWESQRAVGN